MRPKSAATTCQSIRSARFWLRDGARARAGADTSHQPDRDRSPVAALPHPFERSPVVRAQRHRVRCDRGPVAVLAGLFLLLCFTAFPALAQPRVLKIVVTNVGPQAVSESLARANIRIKEGDVYSPMSITEDVRNLYATGYFSDIRVAEEHSLDGVTLYYVLQGKLKLTAVQFSGNKKYSAARLRRKVTAKIGEPIDEPKLFADAQEIKRMYQKAGYPETEVKYVISPDELTGRGTVTFEITEAPKVKIKGVFFEGARAFSQKKLRKVIKTRNRWMFSWLTGSGVLKDEQLDEDKERLGEFYRQEGYIDFDLKEVKYDYLSPRKLVLRFVIHEGQKYRVGAVDFKGVTLFPTNLLREKLTMGVGAIFTPKGLTKDLEALQDVYGAKGYIDARVAARKNANVQTGTMDLVYEFEESEQAFIEKIEIKGNVKTKDRVIRRELAVAPGEVFDMTKVKLSKARVQYLNYFEDLGGVEMQPEPTDVPNRRNLVVAVKEKNTGHFTVGAGFSSLDSVLGFVEMTQGNFDLFSPPYFMGGGQKLRLRAQLGTLRQDYILTFIEPWFFERKLEFSVELYHRDLNFQSVGDLYSERRTGARLGLRRALGSDFLIGGLSYTLENVDIDLDDDLHGPLLVRESLPGGGQIIRVVPPNASAEILREEGARLVSKIGASLTYDTRNHPLFPNGGQWTELSAQLAGGALGGDTDFYKLEMRTAWYFRGILTNHVIEALGRLGVVDRYGDSDRVPLFDRWFLGGIDSLRGYRYRDVGPKDEFEEPIGGGTYWFGSVEYSVPIVERVRFAVFYDIGMVYAGAYSFNPKNFDTGTYNDNWGVGIRLNLPIGPLRLDYGIPIKSDRDNESNGRFQFSVKYTNNF